MENKIITVLGPISEDAFGKVLPHEHIMVDFKGPGESGRSRYRSEHVIEIMKPLLTAAADTGVEGFVDCTPMYMARDPLILAELSRQTGLHIVTNTGYYKAPFLPGDIALQDEKSIAESWISEWEYGIGETGIRPGFIKTAVNPEPLGPIEKKMIAAGARVMNTTGLPMMTHTLFADRAMDIIKILESRGADPGRWIFAHAFREPVFGKIVTAAKEGIWIGLDGIGEDSCEKHADLTVDLLNLGFEDQLLLSQDAGWYRVGEEPGGLKKPFTFLFDRFLPCLSDRGIPDETIAKMTAANPARAFAVQI